MRNHRNENEFDLHENGREGETHFHMNGFARRLVLKQRQRVTQKWPIVKLHYVLTEMQKMAYQHKNNLPIQEEPFFPKPSLQTQLYEPAVLTQSAN